jgi:hypothetical protein
MDEQNYYIKMEEALQLVNLKKRKRELNDELLESRKKFFERIKYPSKIEITRLGLDCSGTRLCSATLAIIHRLPRNILVRVWCRNELVKWSKYSDSKRQCLYLHIEYDSKFYSFNIAEGCEWVDKFFDNVRGKKGDVETVFKFNINKLETFDGVKIVPKSRGSIAARRIQRAVRRWLLEPKYKSGRTGFECRKAMEHFTATASQEERPSSD